MLWRADLTLRKPLSSLIFRLLGKGGLHVLAVQSSRVQVQLYFCVICYIV